MNVKKTRLEQTICDEAEELWAVYLKSGKEEDRQKYLSHVKNCPEDFIALKENARKEFPKKK